MSWPRAAMDKTTMVAQPMRMTKVVRIPAKITARARGNSTE